MDAKLIDSLTKQEQVFCELFVNGSGNEVGDAFLCYKKAYDTNSDYKALRHGQELLLRPDIQEYINYLDCPTEIAAFKERHMKRKITKKLMHIAEECADANYVDRRGNPISPAALRSVAVNAYKTIASINSLGNKVDDESASGGANGASGITFNVIVPQDPSKASIETDGNGSNS